MAGPIWKKQQLFVLLAVISLAFLSGKCRAAEADTNGFARYENEVRSTSWTNEWYTDASVPIEAYAHDRQKADSLYLKKVWPLKGVVVSVRKVDATICVAVASITTVADSESELGLASSIYCYFSASQSKELAELAPFDTVFLKGLGIGRDRAVPVFMGCVLVKTKRHGTR